MKVFSINEKLLWGCQLIKSRMVVRRKPAWRDRLLCAGSLVPARTNRGFLQLITVPEIPFQLHGWLDGFEYISHETTARSDE